jgi:uncharacterized membrane protein YoaK (UPF0700 family)
MAVRPSPPADPRARPALPVLLAFVAGAVDACTVLALFGLFVAQLTGSFVTIGIQVVRQEPAPVAHLLALPLFFLAGAAAAVLVHAFARRRLALALAIETGLLAAFMVTGLAAAPFAHADTASALLAGALGLLAMGVQSATVRLMLPGTPSTNVMTINTTQLAIDSAQWLIAAFRPADGTLRAAAAHRIAALAPIMAAFLAGSIFGAVGFIHAGFWSLLPLVALLLGMVVWAAAAD